MTVKLPKSILPEVRKMDQLRQHLDAKLNAYLNSFSPQAKLRNKPPKKEEIEQIQQMARLPPKRMNVVTKSVYERNRNWVIFVLSRYLEQIKTFDETGHRHRFYTPEMLGREAKSRFAREGAAKQPSSEAAEAQMRVNRKLKGLSSTDEIPLQESSAAKKEKPPPAPSPEHPKGRQVKRKVLVKRIIRKKADGTKEIIEKRTVINVPVDHPEPASRPAAARPRKKVQPPERPVDKEIDDFFKKYNIK